MRRLRTIDNVAAVLLFTVLGFLTMGYHPGAEDDGVYLAAVKAQLRPGLYAHDADFVRLQTQATVFVPAMAALVRATHVPLEWMELAVQFLALFGILWGAFEIARRLFPEPRAHWAGVALLALMFTLPVAGTALYIADQYLHPRNIATALILLGLSRVLARRFVWALVLLVAALAIHPIMGAFGISLGAITAAVQGDWFSAVGGDRRFAVVMAGATLGWIFEPPSATWRQALETRDYYFLSRWTWYEWVGAIAPLVLFVLLRRFAMARGDRALERFAWGVLVYGVLQQGIALVIEYVPGLVRVIPLQPMRYLQLVYVLMVLVAGCLLGRYWLRWSAWRWCGLLLIAGAGMMIPQRALFAGTEHVEWPGQRSRNEWLQAFEWVRENTPEDAYFAIDPRYLAAAGNDAHSFRALAERSVLADAIKDPAVVTQVPQLGPEWIREETALAGWERFGAGDFARVRLQFGVQWVVTKYPAGAGLDCRWHGAALAVCRIGE